MFAELVGYFGVLALLLVLFKKIDIVKSIELFLFKRKRQFDFLKDCYEIEDLDTKVKKVCKDKIDSLVFYETTKIDANKRVRNMLIKFHSRYEEEITWYDIKEAFKFLDLTGSDVNLIFNKRDEVKRQIKITLVYMTLLPLAYSGMRVALPFKAEPNEILMYSLMTFLFFILALIFVNWAEPSQRAARIKKIIESRVNNEVIDEKSLTT